MTEVFAAGPTAKVASSTDCGRLQVGGIGGIQTPPHVPSNARPGVDAYVVRGTNCATALQVMQAYENSLTDTNGHPGAHPVPGWTCRDGGMVGVAGSTFCTNGPQVVEDGIQFRTPAGQRVGPTPGDPTKRPRGTSCGLYRLPIRGASAELLLIAKGRVSCTTAKTVVARKSRNRRLPGGWRCGASPFPPYTCSKGRVTVKFF